MSYDELIIIALALVAFVVITLTVGIFLRLTHRD